jgi:thiol reductant ABC exporter CydD subunit
MDPTGRRLLRESRAARPALAVTGALAVAHAALVLAQAWLLAGVLAHAFLERASLGELRGPLAALLAVSAGRALVAAAFELTGRIGALAVIAELRRRLATQLLSGRPVTAAGERSGELATAAVQGVDALEGWFARYLPQVVLSAVVPASVVVFLLAHDPAAAVVLALTVPVLIVFMILIGLSARHSVQARWRALALLGAHFADVVRGLPTLRAHVRADAQASAIAEISDRYRRATMATLRIAFLSALVLELIAMLGTALVAATVGLQLVAGGLGLHAGLAVLILAPELYAPLRAVGQQFHASADGLGAAERIFAFLDEPATVSVPAAPRPAPDPATSPVELRDVRFAYGGGAADVLAGLSLRIAPGETVAIVGPSGEGKSTLGALLLRLADPASGTVSCGGVDLRDVDPDAWRAQVAWMPQRPLIVAGTVAENVALGAPDATPAQIELACARARADGFVAALPDGMQTRIGDGGRPLSAGQAQRIALARVLLRDAPLLVLDEPTAHLDAATAAEVDDAIAQAARGRMTVLVVHRRELAARADRILELRGGRLAELPAGELAVAA